MIAIASQLQPLDQRQILRTGLADFASLHALQQVQRADQSADELVLSLVLIGVRQVGRDFIGPAVEVPIALVRVDEIGAGKREQDVLAIEQERVFFVQEPPVMPLRGVKIGQQIIRVREAEPQGEGQENLVRAAQFFFAVPDISAMRLTMPMTLDAAPANSRLTSSLFS